MLFLVKKKVGPLPPYALNYFERYKKKVYLSLLHYLTTNSDTYLTLNSNNRF